MSEGVQAGAGLFQIDGGAIPLEGVEVQGDIIGRGAKVTLRQRFRNVEDNPIEVVYKFPLPEGAAICGFKAIVDDRVIEGQIEERDKAFELYDKALSDGHGAQLLDEERPNIFTLSVGNVKPQSTVVIEISYVILMDTHGAEVRFYLPTTISPRYTPENQPDQNGIPVTDIVNPPIALSVPYGLKINVTIHDMKRVSSIGSASHSINTEFTDDTAAICFTSDTAAMDRDFILTIVYRQEFVNRGFVFNDHDDSYVQIDFMPHEDTATAQIDDRIMEREIVFVLDCSGSMAGESIDGAKTALEIMIKALNPGTLFNIYRFGSRFEHLFKHSRAYNEKEMNAALTYIFETDASLGGTEVLAPLKDIYKNRLKDNQYRDIILITDGQIGNEAFVLDLAKTPADKTTLHTVGIGNGPNEFLIKGLARSTGGASELIAPNERLDPKILRIFKKVISGSIRNLRVDWGMDAEQAPVAINAFIGQGVSIFARITGVVAEHESVKIAGETRSGFRTWDIGLSVFDEGMPIPILWAREKIRDIEEGNIQGSRQRERTDRKSSQDIIEISSKFGIVSSETSFIGIERRSESEKSTAEIVLRKVPVMLTKGWGDVSDCKPGILRYSGALAESVYNRESTPQYSIARSRPSYEVTDPSDRVMYCLSSPSAHDEDEDTDLCMPAYLRQGHSVLKERDILLDILSCQQANGGFNDIDRSVWEFIKLSDMRSMADKIGIKNQGDKLKILMTMIILNILELKFWERRDEWEGIVEKSRRWLQSEIEKNEPTIDQQPLEIWMRDFLTKGLASK
jgi:Ca-activated chloride channel family protein